MAIYLSADCIKDAVDRLAYCTAGSSLGDYLIFKRAWVLGKTSESDYAIVTGLESVPYVQAVREFALIDDPDEEDTNRNQPYFIPFATARDRTSGYRSSKFPSNGPSDTVSRWQSRPNTPLVYVRDSKPKAYQFVLRTPEELTAFFLASNAAKDPLSTGKPRLLDVATWWFRSTDFEQRFIVEPTAAQLIDGLVIDLALNTNEIAGLFAQADSA